MRLTGVTLTGVDDAVEFSDMLELSNEFPFLEFGILRSVGRAGDPRYPSDGWVWDMRHRRAGTVCKLSFHLCGSYARDVLDGDLPRVIDIPLGARVQLNGFSQHTDISRLGHVVAANPLTEFICQVSSQAAAQRAIGLRLAHQNVSMLLDKSGGTGSDDREWGFCSAIRTGYAGGINPENVEHVLAGLCAPMFDGDFWIDIESGVRTDNRFDLDKAHDILKRAFPFVAKEAARG